MNFENFEQLFSAFGNIKVAVIGDVMLDTYLFGKVERISPEAPVPIVAVSSKEQRIGGAGNVALNTVALGAATFVVSIIGADNDGEQLTALYSQQGIDTTYLTTSAKRITTNKTRIISSNQQMMRLDTEITKDISLEEEDLLLQQLVNCISTHKPDVLVFEDYNKGVLTERVITEAIALCKQHSIIASVDPKRKNFFAYKGVEIFKPNLKEVKEGLNLLIEEINPDTLSNIHWQLNQQLQHQVSLITLSEKGVFYQLNSQSAIIPTHIRTIADVSGAGDTVIAVASLVYATTKDIHLAAEIANIAGGLVCEEVGTVAIDKQKLFNECKALLHIS
ncbi:bifunctional heptose 7-phosphate kinase/heptose 1-phosphate adenyltransferase [Parasediminibacterium sp. JCM 36343]|uniref:bifunctional heptose 7-phosphate kinase/heptose 1-phosphate adenyltransferase n=1 Tax=Parasediminibacterium sp. JCM 36343 TaxID=3374279 RepID=UPI00397CA437